jgi:hypothetical protein
MKINLTDFRVQIGLYESVYLVTRKRKWPHSRVEHLVQKFRLPAKFP